MRKDEFERGMRKDKTTSFVVLEIWGFFCTMCEDPTVKKLDTVFDRS